MIPEKYFIVANGMLLLVAVEIYLFEEFCRAFKCAALRILWGFFLVLFLVSLGFYFLSETPYEFNLSQVVVLFLSFMTTKSIANQLHKK